MVIPKSPHEITRNQHILPKRSIERFTDDDGTVHVYYKPEDKCFRAKPDNPLFCAKHSWDQKAEDSFKAEIEDPFQKLADKICIGKYSVTVDDYVLITRFYALIYIRFKMAKASLATYTVSGTPQYKINADEADYLEKNHITPIMPDGTIPPQHIASIKITQEMIWNHRAHRKHTWGVIESLEGEFIVSDTYEGKMIVPISPTIQLVADKPSAQIGTSDVQSFNKLVLDNYYRYFIGKDFSKAPGFWFDKS